MGKIRASIALCPELNTMLDKVVTSHKDILFVKGTNYFPQCGFSNTVEYSQWPTFLQLYINGEFFGGCDITVGGAFSNDCLRAKQSVLLSRSDKLVPFTDNLDLYRLELTDLLANVEADVPILMYKSKKYTFFSMLGVTEYARVDIQLEPQRKEGLVLSVEMWKATTLKLIRIRIISTLLQKTNSTPVLQMLIRKSDRPKVYLFASPLTDASYPTIDFFAAPGKAVAPEMKPAESSIQSSKKGASGGFE
ncbi:monothiol glutaredoxin-S7, chloroplastic [Tanacetum coccineum]|uniref:Monothiol glutaredoxin-S7, chloroplastic n=1 Tax=Tanacetum coccineum TaxID=301880 RepID=A0ABQ5HHW5_9ASTR